MTQNSKQTSATPVKQNRSAQLQKLCILALLAAIGYLSLYLIKIKLFGFLSYEIKDVFLTLGGFLYGPPAALALSLVTALLELPTSDTGVIGMVMNAISSALFTVTAAGIYQRHRTLRGAILGLLCGIAAMTTGMLLWNYLITPLYMGVSREQVAGMLTTVFLPFNLVKSTLNAAITMLIYKPFTRALRMLHLLPATTEKHNMKASIITGVLSILIMGACVAAILKINGVI
ncbi:MAG: ECF transporter S component [Oscillospiraceae bacterium]